MAWQMLVIVAQLSAGAVLVMLGLRLAVNALVARADKPFAESLSRRAGRPLGPPGRSVAIGLAMMAVGAVLLFGIDVTADALPRRYPEP